MVTSLIGELCYLFLDCATSLYIFFWSDPVIFPLIIYCYCGCNYYYFSFISYRHCKHWNRQKECKIKLIHKILVKIALLVWVVYSNNSLMNVISLLVRVFWMVYLWSWQENKSSRLKEAGFSYTFRNLRIHAKQFFLKVHSCSSKFFLFFQVLVILPSSSLFFQVLLVLWITHFSPASS